jgi:hypothetical protein
VTDLPVVQAAAPALVRHRGAVAALSIPEAMQFAEAVAKADGMIPRAYLGNPGKILACVLAGQELGVGPMASLRAFHVVEGKPVASYDFWIARLRAAGYRVEWPELSTERVTLRLTSPNGETHSETWDKARAQAAGLWGGKDPWRKYPQTMLQARCVATAGRAFAGEVMFGCYETDEGHELRGDRQPAPAAAPQAPAPQTAAERVAAAIGGSVEAAIIDPEVAALAKRVGDLAKNLGYSREAFFAFLAQRDLPAQRLTSFTVAQLEAMLEDLAIQAEESSEPEHTTP